MLARFYLRDDAAQASIATKILAGGDVFVPKTVILELEWVLRYVAALTAPSRLELNTQFAVRFAAMIAAHYATFRTSAFPLA